MNLSRMTASLGFVGLAAVALLPIVLGLRIIASPPGRSTAAAQRPDTARATLAGFDGDRAYQYLVDQCRIGPRVSGTEGNRALRRLVTEHFRGVGGEVELQPFESRHPVTGQAVELENVVASWHRTRARRVLLAAHFDTRPHADLETDPKKKAEPFLGANDGASGVAVLMELGNLMDDLRTSAGVDLVMFDGEELVYDDVGDYFLGSSHFAQLYRRGELAGRYEAAIVIDMVGDRKLEIYPEQNSQRQSAELVRSVWGVAKRLRVTAFRDGRGHEIRDDHMPLLEAGIPAIDVIDFDYPHWHRISDTPDKCSARSLAQVGGVLAEWLRGR